jgi:phage antirepressor YoqD-like protein
MNGRLDYDLIIETARRKKEALAGLEAAEVRSIQLERQIEADRPFTERGREVMEPEFRITFGEMTGILNNKGIRMTRVNLFQWGREQKLCVGNHPTFLALDKGFLTMKTGKDCNGMPRVQTVITPKGQTYILSWFARHPGWKPPCPRIR